MIEPRRGSAVFEVERRRGQGRRTLRDRVAVEEPLEIRVRVPAPAGSGARPSVHRVAVTMRTPGDDFELAVGFLFSEGLLSGRDDVRTVSYCTGPETQEYNVVSVELRRGAAFDPALLDRNFYTTSSCGVCGKASLESVEVRGCPVFPEGSGPRLDPEWLKALPDRLRREQGLFRKTGGLHAAALVRPRTATPGSGSTRDPAPTRGDPDALAPIREDVGRHNAVDKVVGHELLAGRLPAADALLLVSGRASFEILQKALAAGVPAVAAVGAPSSLAVDLARRFGMTLVGFLRADGFNTYAGPARVVTREGGA